MTLKQSSAVHIQALVSADVILLGSNSKLRLLVINLASVPGTQLVNSPTAAILNRCVLFLTDHDIHLNSRNSLAYYSDRANLWSYLLSDFVDKNNY